MKNKTPQNDDARFDKVYTDPRFIQAPNKMKKVEIDSRFKKMFDDKQFNVIAKVDKYGRKIEQKDKFALQNYYNKEMEEQGQKFYDEHGHFQWEGKSSNSGSDSDSEDKQSSSGSEMTYSDEMSGVWSDLDEPEDTAKPATDDVKVGKRLAITNLDWDSISATDLLVLFQSFCQS